MIGPSACPAATMKRIHLLSCGQCQRCRGVWFDQHELEGVLAFIPSSLADGDYRVAARASSIDR
ncbi:MAG: Zn-finger nucleic acid-binding protein [Planctomycetota bacterium]|jgi:Zn-finger nucleic acid-binding protein